MSTTRRVAVGGDPFANGLWESLPEQELGLKIATHVAMNADMRTKNAPELCKFRLINRAFAEAFRAPVLCTVPITHRRHAEWFVKGVVTIACTSALHHVRMSTDMYTHVYTTVYTACTQKPPGNLSEDYYNWLMVSAHTMYTVLGDHHISEEEQRKMLVFIRAVFGYLDRFYVKRFTLDTLSVVLTNEINKRNAARKFAPLPALPERGDPKPSRQQAQAVAADDAALTAALTGMEAAAQQWATLHAA